MFKPGDQVTCIDNESLSGRGKLLSLKPGKDYIVEKITNLGLGVKLKGVMFPWTASRFMLTTALNMEAYGAVSNLLLELNLTVEN